MRLSLTSRLSVISALLPALMVMLVVYIGATSWTAWMSLTNSRMLPNNNFIGFRQYQLLFSNDRWLTSVHNIVIYGVLFVSLALLIGFLLAVAIDQRVRAEDTIRSIYLYPYSMSFVVTGLVWQWLLNPTLGVQYVLRSWGFAGASFDWIVRPETAIYCLVIAGVWQASGLVMAIMLAGLRGIDDEIWKAARVDGLPKWRVYISIIIPMMGASFATAAVLLSTAVVRLYDLSVSMTNGGPGIASEVPAKFVMDHLFERANIGLGGGAKTTTPVTVR